MVTAKVKRHSRRLKPTLDCRNLSTGSQGLRKLTRRRQRRGRRRRPLQLLLDDLAASSCSRLETDGYNATSPDRTAVDFLVYQPGNRFVRGIQRHRRVVPPALNAETRVEVAGQEPGTGETSRPGHDLGICTQLAQ